MLKKLNIPSSLTLKKSDYFLKDLYIERQLSKVSREVKKKKKKEDDLRNEGLKYNRSSA